MTGSAGTLGAGDLAADRDIPGVEEVNGRAEGRITAGQSVQVRVPASSANVGPGYDTLGLALDLYDTLTVSTTDGSGIEVDVTGEGAADVPRDGRHLVVQVMLRLWEQAEMTAPGLRLEAHNVIPHGRGLGSSAAAVVSGALAANALLPEDRRHSRTQLLQLCAELEGHPDNVAPTLNGGLAISWHADGEYHTVHAEVLPQVVPVLAIPATPVSTETARALLPHSVSHLSAAVNAGRAALLVHALTRDPSCLLAATEDSLHQGYRASAMLPSAGLMRALRAQGYASTISGAGPSVLTLANGAAEAERVVQAVQQHLDSAVVTEPWRVLALKIAAEGAKLEGHQR